MTLRHIKVSPLSLYPLTISYGEIRRSARVSCAGSADLCIAGKSLALNSSRKVARFIHGRSTFEGVQGSGLEGVETSAK